MPRVIEVKSARKAQGPCGRCGVEIKAGDGYKWLKFRYGGRRVRCGACSFRPSERTQSKLSQVYAAQEAMSDTLASWNGDLDDLKSDIESNIDEIDEVRSEYEEAAEAMGEAGEQHRERADELESWIDDLRSLDYELEAFEGARDEDTDEPKDAEEFEAWKTRIAGQVADKFGECPV